MRLAISDAALRLGRSYWVTRDLVLKGEVRGGRDENGHLYADARDVERLAGEQKKQTA